ncbi:ABC transporter permease [Desulfuromonas acetoxidans]|uniref:ABC-2 domain protein n=1 Tax=Desulfuromonas acetoxidans (strain DSM 684 / 11070) TaxID=281689 RepID=Q1K0S1_DESA6|nr:ABC transporter permease [Desulfuromonas acetoxidans]EAT15870.1 ABC-2 domain protein [Desulfuromonas acetoxidans DSM 684]MBF0646876.1 ABC transporter permease [Desulfuromonas acetoxidans]NVD24470.1 ABC transporter permease [Desulfuromonas acetoxidans]NVE16581.1 ABC transporter permease [Desulfuromonas acetoxidans]
MIGQLWAVIVKELQLLRRDRGGLAVLFIMPVALVLVVCLVQDNILKTSGAAAVDVLVVDHDQATFGPWFISQLQQQGDVRVSVATDDLSFVEAQRQVERGDYQFGVYLSPQLSHSLQQAVDSQVRRQLFSPASSQDSAMPSLFYSFDPAVQGGLRAGLTGLIDQLVRRHRAELCLEAFQRYLPKRVEHYVTVQLGPMFSQALAQHPLELDVSVESSEMMVAPLESEAGFTMPTSIQHNVPAWSIFGLFFIVLPLATVMLQERSQGVFVRLQMIPGSMVPLLVGRVVAYLMISLVQFALMLGVGRTLLPLLGTDHLDLHGQVPSLLVVSLCVALAACGFGLLLGVYARSSQQASLTAAVTIVIFAALGGIMIPVYLMPEVMQHVSVISPLGWGMEAMQILVLRGGCLAETWPYLLRLVICFIVCCFFAWRGLRRRC